MASFSGVAQAAKKGAGGMYTLPETTVTADRIPAPSGAATPAPAPAPPDQAGNQSPDDMALLHQLGTKLKEAVPNIEDILRQAVPETDYPHLYAPLQKQIEDRPTPKAPGFLQSWLGSVNDPQSAKILENKRQEAVGAQEQKSNDLDKLQAEIVAGHTKDLAAKGKWKEALVSMLLQKQLAENSPRGKVEAALAQPGPPSTWETTPGTPAVSPTPERTVPGPAFPQLGEQPGATGGVEQPPTEGAPEVPPSVYKPLVGVLPNLAKQTTATANATAKETDSATKQKNAESLANFRENITSLKKYMAPAQYKKFLADAGLAEAETKNIAAGNGRGGKSPAGSKPSSPYMTIRQRTLPSGEQVSDTTWNHITTGGGVAPALPENLVKQVMNLPGATSTTIKNIASTPGLWDDKGNVNMDVWKETMTKKQLLAKQKGLTK